MNLIYIDDSRQKEWENLTKTNPASGYMQSFFWTKFKNKLGWQSYKIGITENKILTGGAIVTKYAHMKNRNFLQITEGPVLPYETPKKAERMFRMLLSEIDSIAELSGDSRSSHISVEPKLMSIPPYFSRFRKSPIDQQPIRTLLIDLTLSEDELLRQMKPKCRYNIKIAQKHGVTITKTNLPDGINDFLKLYKPFVKRKKIDAKRDDYFLCLSDMLQDIDESTVYFAALGDTILSTAIVLYYGTTATFLYGASSNFQRNSMASYLMQWQILQDAKKLGFRTYDFYSLAPGEKTDTHPWEGFSVFKRKFGGTEINYIGAYDFIYNEALYQRHLAEDL
jgi:peptidoglycan pentaglycine glycine transferase (the first glycine)